METIDLGINFVKGWEPTPTPSSDSIDELTQIVTNSGSAQTGDFNIMLITGAVLAVCLLIGFFVYSLAKNRQFVGDALHASNKSFAFINLLNLSLPTKIIGALIGAAAVICIVIGCFFVNTNNAHAANEESPIFVTPDTIKAVVAEDGHVSNWNPTSATLENTSATEKFNFTACKVSLTEDAKDVDALKNATIKIIGFDNQVVYNDKASDEEITCTGLTLDKSSTTNLVFEINDFLDVTQLDSVFDKQIFKISLGAEKAIPEHENLCDYNLDELKQISNYLAENYSEESTDPVCVQFRNFRDNGIKSDGSDNGIAMNEELKNHWAIDANGKLFGEDGFVNDRTTIQARIIGICEDVDKDNNIIGLTFMTTHALSMVSVFEWNTSEFAKYGWAGPTEDGSCTLRAKLADGTLFPTALNDLVTAAQKGYEFSSTLGSGIAIDKFWAPSMAELYGSDLSGDNRWPANDTTEGKQYTAFKIKGITSSEETCKPFGFIGRYQDRSSDTTAVWTRSLWKSLNKAANDIYGSYAGSPSGRPGSSNVDNMNSPGIIACFCI